MTLNCVFWSWLEMFDWNGAFGAPPVGDVMKLLVILLSQYTSLFHSFNIIIIIFLLI